jgi:NADH-quinone oxidoreductase subunit E
VTEAGFLLREVPDVEGPILSDEDRRRADELMARYPSARSSLVPLLYLVQSKVGWIPKQGMREVADLLGLTTAEVEGVATFYTMLKLHPTGRWVFSICTNPPCAGRGGKGLLEYAMRSLGGEAEHVTPDGLFTVEEEECMGACDKAPVLSINYVFYDRVTPEEFDTMVSSLRRDEVPAPPRGSHPGDLKAVSSVLAGVAGWAAGGAAGEDPSADAGDPTAPPAETATEPSTGLPEAPAQGPTDG